MQAIARGNVPSTLTLGKLKTGFALALDEAMLRKANTLGIGQTLLLRWTVRAGRQGVEAFYTLVIGASRRRDIPLE